MFVHSVTYPLTPSSKHQHTQFPQIKIILNGEKIKIYVWEIVKNCFYGAAAAQKIYISVSVQNVYIDFVVVASMQRDNECPFLYDHVNGIKYVYNGSVGMASNFYFPILNDLNCYKN